MIIKALARHLNKGTAGQHARPPEMESPSPIPEVFVVKNGSKICVSLSRVMPGPVLLRLFNVPPLLEKRLA
jgi:hypothetical protein